MSYSLSALLKLRAHRKNQAESSLKDASSRHEAEKNKLEQIKYSLENTTNARAKLQDNFFLKSRLSGCNKRELICHASSSQKTICDENDLKKCLKEQEEAVRFAAMKLAIAQSTALDAHRNLKLIEKHYDLWQLSHHKAEKIREEYENDDLNSAKIHPEEGIVATDQVISKEGTIQKPNRPKVKNLASIEKHAMTKTFNHVLLETRDRNKSSHNRLSFIVSIGKEKTKEPSDSSIRQDLHQENDLNYSPSYLPQFVNYEKMREHNPHIIAHARAFTQKEDELNRLLKKLTLSFAAKKNESQFVIGIGVFHGARFHVMTENNDLSLHITNASTTAKNLLNHHRDLLKNRLAHREINLKAVRFMS